MKKEIWKKIDLKLSEFLKSAGAIISLTPDAFADSVMIYKQQKKYIRKTSKRIKEYYKREFYARRFVRGRAAREISAKEYAENRDELLRRIK